MRRANVSQLKARLSAYLAEVRRGETVVVYDRATPIARLVPFETQAAGFVVEEAAGAPSVVRKVSGVRLRRGVDVVRLLRESRDQR